MRCTTGWLKPLCRPFDRHHAAQAHHSPVHDGRTRNRCGPLSVPSRGTCTDRGGGRPDRGAIRQSVRQAVAHLRRSRSAGYGRARGHDPGWRRLQDRIESTIVKLDRDGDGEFLTLLRPGGITYDALCCVCERVAIAPAVTELLSADVRPLSPGMKYKHYAPATPVVLLEGTPEHVLSYLQERQKTERCAILCYDEEIPHLLPGGLLPVGARDDLATHAHTLFARLRES